MDDRWEAENSLDPLAADEKGDADGDGISNLEECWAGTDPHNDTEPVYFIEDFETSEFSLCHWYNKNYDPWEVTSHKAFSGSWSAYSVSVGRKHRELTTQVNCAAGSVAFDMNLARTGDYNHYLHFYIDGDYKCSWSGDIDWQQVRFQVSEGRHEFIWQYYTEASEITEDDGAWIDNIRFTGSPDTDEDDIPDGWEYRFFDALDQDMTGDSDGDGYTDRQEYENKTDPLVED